MERFFTILEDILEFLLGPTGLMSLILVGLALGSVVSIPAVLGLVILSMLLLLAADKRLKAGGGIVCAMGIVIICFLLLPMAMASALFAGLAISK